MKYKSIKNTAIILEENNSKPIENISFDDVLSKERRKDMTYSPHMIISGGINKGVNFVSKKLLNQKIYNTEDKVVIIDLFGDFKDVIFNIPKENVEVIKAFGDICINPLEIIGYKEDYPSIYCEKVDFLESLFSYFLGRNLFINEKICLNKAYQSIKNKENATFQDLMDEFKKIDSVLSQFFVDLLTPYLDFKVFNSESTNTNTKVTYIDLSEYKVSHKEVVFLFVIEWLHGQMFKNLQEGKSTFVFIPYLEKLKNIPANYLSYIVKKARIRGGEFLFSTYKLELFANKYINIFTNIATILLLDYESQSSNFIKDYLGIANQIEKINSIENNDCFLIEGGNLKICKL